MGSELSAVAIWTLEPQIGGVNGEGECWRLDGSGHWNCNGACLTQFFMLVLSALLMWSHWRSTPTH